MAYKEDTFWEEHEPVYSESDALREKAEDRGMVAEEVSDWRKWGPSLVLSIPLLYFVTIATLRSGVDRANALFAFMMLFPIALLLTFVLQSAVRRYRLVEDDTWVEHSPPPRRRPHALLLQVLGTHTLYARVGPPQAGESPIYFHPDIRGVGHWYVVPFYVLAMCNALVGVMLYASPLALLYITFILLHVFRAGYMRARVKAGVRVFGMGVEGKAEEKPPHRFEAVQRAELRWDTLLQQSYLLLSTDNGDTRYYSPTNDPLYLARLAKHRIPEGVLQRRDGDGVAIA